GSQSSFASMSVASASASASARPSTVAPDASQLAQLSSAPLDMATDLVVLRDLIASLDALLASGTIADPELVARYLSMIQLLESRKGGY
ncbi:MAG TPA: hypothetical protein PLC54_07355, partial [Spirochaetales bacterium]|nr:hypothetical protein [Spirochaetales bacterium]